MKILILSCNTGQGHNAAGMAVYYELLKRKIDCEMKDAFSFCRPNTSKNASKIYVGITTKIPKVFGIAYKLGEFISSRKYKSPVYFLNISGAKRIMRYICENNVDIVIVPHLFPAEMLTYMKRKMNLKAKCYAIATDYTCIPFWEETELDGYFIPHIDLIDEFAGKGISRKILIPTGIPVHEKYKCNISKEAARKKLDLHKYSHIFLVMTGSMGFGNVKNIVKELVDIAKAEDKIVVLGGNNKKLKTELRKQYNEDNKVAIMDFTNKVNLYMKACDVLLTKPGGLTSTEAAVKETALVHTEPIPGCETKNAKFFCERGMSLSCKTPKNSAVIAEKLVNNPKIKKNMVKAQRKNINKNAAKDICDYILTENM